MLHVTGIETFVQGMLVQGDFNPRCKFLGARAPLELAHVKKKEKVLNSDKLLSPASTCTLILDT